LLIDFISILYVVVKNIEERMKMGLYRPKLDHDHELDVAIALTGDNLNGNLNSSHDDRQSSEDSQEESKPH
jgi:hypothetical protein